MSKRKPKRQLETKNSSREEAWALSALVDAEWIQLVLQRFIIHGQMAESIMTELYALSYDDDGNYIGREQLAQDKDKESRAVALLPAGERIVAAGQDMYLYLSHFLRTQPISLPPQEVEAIREAAEIHLRMADYWRLAYGNLLGDFPDMTCSPRNDSASKRHRELFQGLLDALDTEVEIIEGCKREVRELAADAPNREFTIVEVVNLVHHLYQHASHLSNALGEYMHHRSREPAVAITRKWERLHRLGGGVQRFPMTQEETTAVRERLSAVSSCRWECRTFIEEHMPVLMRHDAAPWARFYPLWEQRHQPPQPKPRRRSPEELQALWARFWQWQEQQEDIANAPYVFAKFRSRPRRVPHRRIDPVPPRGARTRVSAPATAAAAAAEAAAGPLLPDGERVVVRDSAQRGGRRRSQAADRLQGSRRRVTRR
ncbi:hypothetical protein JKP88DRAFT_290473 [Tribonema minus]|uniref:Uncharacterized protein n=1 Tax=Tribonema minus TaxID=303371 RepID=A0A835YYX3_9STRA|nr:hypothetical protein JKP88DRAFT_290473 [Tribonema minus]